MKKIITLALLTAVLSLSVFCGCSKEQDEKTQDQKSAYNETVSQTESSETEESIIQDSEASQQSSDEESKTESSDLSDNEESSLDFVDFSTPAQDYTLEEFYNSPQAKVMIDTAKGQYSSDMYDIDVSLKDEHTVIVSATLKKDVDESEYTDDMVDMYFESAKEKADSYIKLLETTTTTKNIQVEAKLISHSGKELAIRTFTISSDNNNEDEDDDNDSMTLQDIADSGLIQSSLKGIASSFADGTAEVSTAVEDNNVLVITVQLQQCVPDEGVSLIKEQLENVSDSLSLVEQQLRTFTNNSNVSVKIKIIDACGKIVAGR